MMKPKIGFWILALAIVAVILISGCAQQPKPTTENQTILPEFNCSQSEGLNDRVEVVITKDGFTIDSTSVLFYSSITFVNSDEIPHTIKKELGNISFVIDPNETCRIFYGYFHGYDIYTDINSDKTFTLSIFVGV